MKMKLFLITIFMALEFVVCEPRAEDSASSNSNEANGVVGKVENAIEHGVEATAGGIERGVEATKNGIQRGAQAAAHGLQRGIDATTNGIARGASATARAFDHVAKKLGGPSASEPETDTDK